MKASYSIIRCTISKGFSLVEIMVGLVIGMIAVIVMMQIFSVFDSNKRTTVGADDAQNNGAIALHELQREIRQSGYGISDYNLIGCNLTLRDGVALTPLAPVVINPVTAAGTAAIPAGDANTDIVMVAYGNSPSSQMGDGVLSQTTENYFVRTPNSFTRPDAPALGDWIIAEPIPRPNPCNLSLDRVQAIDPPKPAAPLSLVVEETLPAMVNGNIYNLGLSPVVKVFAIRAGNLTACDYLNDDCGSDADKDDPTVWVPIANGVVSMRAQYGHDVRVGVITGSYIVEDESRDYNQTQPTNNCEWARTPSVRLALVIRNSQYDKNTDPFATPVAPEWDGSTGTSPAPIDLSDNADWKHYRYKVFQTVVPVRNVAWMGVQPSC